MANLFEEEKKTAIDMVSVWDQQPEKVLIRVPFGASAEAMRAEMQTLRPGHTPEPCIITEAPNAALGTTHTVEMTVPDMVAYFEAVRKREENKPASPDISSARVDDRTTPIFNKMLDDTFGKADGAILRLPVSDPDTFRTTAMPMAGATPMGRGAVDVAISKRHETAKAMTDVLVKAKQMPDNGAPSRESCAIAFDPETAVPMGIGPHYTLSADNFVILNQLAMIAKEEARHADKTVHFPPPTDTSSRTLIAMAGLQAMAEERAEKLNPNPAGSNVSQPDGANVTRVDFKKGEVIGRGWPDGSGSGGEQS